MERRRLWGCFVRRRERYKLAGFRAAHAKLIVLYEYLGAAAGPEAEAMYERVMGTLERPKAFIDMDTSG